MDNRVWVWGLPIAPLTQAQAAEAVRVADAAVVGSALCSTIEVNLGKPDLVERVLEQVSELAAGVRGARELPSASN